MTAKTTEQRNAEFLKDLEELLAKHDATLEVEWDIKRNTRHEIIAFSHAKFENNKCVEQMLDLNLGRYVTGN